jgi:hypothetical protein
MLSYSVLHGTQHAFYALWTLCLHEIIVDCRRNWTLRLLSMNVRISQLVYECISTAKKKKKKKKISKERRWRN